MPRTSEPTPPLSAEKAKKPRPKKAAVAANGSGDVRLTADRLVVRPPADGERKSSGGLLIPATKDCVPRRPE